MAEIVMTFSHLKFRDNEQRDFDGNINHGWYWPDHPGTKVRWDSGFHGFCTKDQFSNLSASLIEAAYNFDTFTGVRVEMLFKELGL